MKGKMNILLVDDDPNILGLVKMYLEKEGYEVVTADRGDTALDIFKKNPPHLMLLDIMLPGMDGRDVCREVRKTSNIPIIMLSAKGETFDRVLGLELGADDYIVKPFDPKELIARIKAVSRRFQSTEAESEQTISFPGLTVSLSEYSVSYAGKPVDMPPKELEVLYFLGSNPNRVFTRQQLLEQIWGFDFFGDSRTVDQHVKRLRDKLPDSDKYGWRIETVWSVGYKFELKA